MLILIYIKIYIKIIIYIKIYNNNNNNNNNILRGKGSPIPIFENQKKYSDFGKNYPVSIYGVESSFKMLF